MASAAKTNRGYLAAAIDRFVGWRQGLPRESCSWCVEPVRIPMRDGIKLSGDLYEPVGLPKGTSPSGLLFLFTPYGRGLLISLFSGHAYAARGYQVLIVSMRGTFGSDGIFLPGEDEASDAVDVVAWMRLQSWYPGRFGTIGASFCGWAQWSLLRDPPKDCAASAISVGPHDLWDWHWGSGAFRLERVAWSNLLARQEDPALIPALMRLSSIKRAADTALKSLPVRDSMATLLGQGEPSALEAAMWPSPDDAYWLNKRQHEGLERVRVDMPILLTSGWFDTFAQQTLKQYQRLQQRGCQVELIIGPWDHGEAGQVKIGGDVFRFIERTIGGKQPESDAPKLPRARVFISGSDEWKTTVVWPPKSSPLVMYLDDDKGISNQPPPKTTSSTSFTFDPANPTPALGGPLLVPISGRVDDSAYAARTDILTFTSRPIEDDNGLLVMGAPSVHLMHSSDTGHADLWIRLSEVDLKGVSHNITEDYRAIDPERNTESPVTVELRDCAHRFLKGTRIRLTIAGGSWPIYARNLGTGENRMTSVDMRPTKHTIQHAEGQSRLILPIPLQG
ncbi:X-Pro dipeptidyl-peptidase domain-containing protein [Trichoderma pleuroticola]